MKKENNQKIHVRITWNYYDGGGRFDNFHIEEFKGTPEAFTAKMEKQEEKNKESRNGDGIRATPHQITDLKPDFQ